MEGKARAGSMNGFTRRFRAGGFVAEDLRRRLRKFIIVKFSTARYDVRSRKQQPRGPEVPMPSGVRRFLRFLVQTQGGRKTMYGESDALTFEEVTPDHLKGVRPVALDEAAVSAFLNGMYHRLPE
jgi:hypothetical protein